MVALYFKPAYYANFVQIKKDVQSIRPTPFYYHVIPARFERATYCLEGSCSIQLSYGINISTQILI